MVGARCIHTARLPLGLVLGVAVVVRVGWWVWSDGPRYGSDSRQYLTWAAMLAGGDLSVARDWLFHLVYPLTLAPMYLLRLPEGPYVFALHMLASVGSVWLLSHVAALVAGRRYGLGVAAAGAVYPSVLFWFPYVLTETVFLFCLLLFLFVTLLLLRRARVGEVVLFGLAALLLVFARPVALVLVAAAIAAVVSVLLGRRWGWWRGVAAALLVCTALAALVAASLAVAPGLRERVLRMPTVAQSLWLSARVSSSNIHEIETMMPPPLPPETPEEEVWAYKRAYALRFIAEQPGTYLTMAARRFVAFWYPWLFAAWSLPHRLVDAALSLALTVGLLAALACRMSRTPEVVVLGVLALALAVLSAFSQIDSEARYRLPAELILLPVAPLGLQALGRTIARRSGMTGLGCGRAVA